VPRRLRKKGLLLVISAPSGCGKTTISKKLLSIFPNLTCSRSVTTRPPRDNEMDGKDYFFVSRKEFFKMRKKGELLEWASNFGNFYGTPRRFVKKTVNDGKDILLAIDVKGAKNIRKLIPESVHVFLMPPSIADLKKRLRGRGTDKLKDVKKRLAIAKREMAQAKLYDYVVMNDSIKNAVAELREIVSDEKNKLKRQAV